MGLYIFIAVVLFVLYRFAKSGDELSSKIESLENELEDIRQELKALRGDHDA